MNEKYTESHQEVLITFMLSSNELFVRARNIIKPSYFDKKFQKTVKFILEHTDQYNALPNKSQVIAAAGHEFEIYKHEEVKPQEEWFLENIESFCRHKAMESAIEGSVEQLEKGNYSVVEEKVKDALLISLNKDLGLDLFKDPVSFIETLRDKDNIKSTGWKSVDEKLYGGFNQGELNIFAGAPGTGKSLFLQNLALNWVEAGMDVIYLTFELSEELTGMRLNAMITGKTTKDVFRDTTEVGTTIKTLYKMKKWGNITIKFMPIGTTANDIKSYLKEFEIQVGKKPDALVVDYLDLLHPNNRRVSPSDLFVKDKYVSEELRSLMQENKLYGATASQLNRAAMEEQEHEMYHIAGGVSKINTADNVMTIYTSQTLKDQGAIRLQFIKTRSSSGVGHRVFLAFDNTSLRIRDGEDDDEDTAKKDISELGEKFKRKSKMEAAEAAQQEEDNKAGANGGAAAARAVTAPKKENKAEAVATTGRDVRALINKNRAKFEKASD